MSGGDGGAAWPASRVPADALRALFAAGLADDFPYALLVLLTAAMTAGAVALRRLASRTEVKRKWE